MTRRRRTTCSSAPRAAIPRRSNYADDFLTPAAEGLYPARKGIRRPVYVTAEPWPGIPIRQGNRKHKAADLADGTWPNLTGKFKPHDDRHTHSTWLDAADLNKVIQMDRRGHAMPAWTPSTSTSPAEMRQRLCDVLEAALARRRDRAIQARQALASAAAGSAAASPRDRPAVRDQAQPRRRSDRQNQ